MEPKCFENIMMPGARASVVSVNTTKHQAGFSRFLGGFPKSVKYSMQNIHQSSVKTVLSVCYADSYQHVSAANSLLFWQKNGVGTQFVFPYSSKAVLKPSYSTVFDD